MSKMANYALELEEEIGAELQRLQEQNEKLVDMVKTLIEVFRFNAENYTEKVAIKEAQALLTEITNG
jgi:hypothetical protein